ncbi:helix-turn-helix transcriptional regulator [Rathayibacter soli]|uniref:helix-turn-helix transcriptional regulator n=1 Tax=Rathayibacter soli TaxID=3144168 RepID=UPI0027E549D5|nr:helix-turn-helix domain-containing protein [Glaciibacter superstes]
MTTSLEDQHAALASRIRRDVLSALTEAQGPLDAAAIAARFDVHVTTARFHLEQLEHAGLVTRSTQHAGGRGRPRVVFEAVPVQRNDDALRQLSEVLVDALAHDADGGRSRAREAGERWASAYADETADKDVDAAEPIIRIFNQLGFEPELSTESVPGDDGAQRVIALHGCPFRELATEYPDVVCSAHRGLLEGAITRLGHDRDDATLRPFVEPQLCQVRLLGALATH